MAEAASSEWSDTRYSRQEAIPLFGEGGQRLLSNSSVAVVGAGGVKSSLLFQLVAAGVGRVRVIDFDKVEVSNLNRQILYTTADVGRYKAEAAAGRLNALNPEVQIEPIINRVTSSNFDELLSGFDLIFEGGDSGAARKDFNKEALARNLTYIHASAQYNYAYVFTVVPYSSACFECVFFDLPNSHGGPVPVIGCATLVAGAFAACEAINILSGAGPKLTKRMLLHDGWANETFNIEIARRLECDACGRPK